ncbi:synaptotagmin-like protein 2 isoform X1 [Varanus komodoensis]|uniref:synaptotagmin-like protein 2 isoform X1 n=2 Tax=Varanus komodoensis TaxID=61221 RepID=UPI001CF79A79|nr:synaptotagmin-like protein 2 isoform X1 [Varanus komodoensis]
MLDLNFLTEEEYGKLMQVLQRDAELKRKDGDRIRRMQRSLKDEKKKKCLTGQWFHEVKAQRFQEELEGTELLRASIKKKRSDSGYENNEHARESPESGEASLPSEATVLPSPSSEEERSCEPFLDSAQEHRAKPKPRLRLSTLPSTTEKRSSLDDTSPVDSGVGVSPFLATRSDSPEYGKGCENLQDARMSAKLAEGELDGFLCSAGGEVVDPAAEHQAVRPVQSEEDLTPSRIPVKRKSSRGLSSPITDTDNGAETHELGLSRKESLKGSRLPTLRKENSHPVKHGANYTVSSMSNKDEEIGLDREHFKNLKNFWEKGSESALANDMSEKPIERANNMEGNGRPSRLNWSLSAPCTQSGDDRPSGTVHPKTRVPYRTPASISSSEDEPTYISPPRKGSGSAIPRSTYGRSKGAMINRSNLSDGDGKSSQAEEEKKVPRCPRRSKLPIRVPSIKLETPAPQQAGIIFEPETPADEFVMAEESKHRHDSLSGRVQILIESVPSEDADQAASAAEENSDVGTAGELEGKETVSVEEQQMCSSEGNLLQNEAAAERGKAQEMASSLLSEADRYRVPIAKKITRPNGYHLAKSMVNLYTTTETYTKPQMLTHQYLEPERAKDLTKSTPLLLSETESDTASELSFQFSRHKKCPSVGSHSSDMASVSSVSGSVLSVYSGDFGSVSAQGLVQFALDYDEKNREFQIFVSQCQDLAIVDEKKGRTDPYVKTYLLPDKARMGKRKTSVKKRTLSPIYNEVLRYKIEKMVLLIQKLNLSVWHNDPLGRNSFLGEMEIDLAGWDWQNNKLNWYMLKPRSLSAINSVDHRGVMNLSIKYIPPGSLGRKTPPSGEVHIWVKDTKDLPQLRPSGVDSFVKCYVLPDTSKKSYQKTRIVKRDSNPVFNHTIVYDGFHTEDLKDACVELTVWDHEKLTNHFLGGIRLGLGTGYSYGIPVDWMDSTQEEVAFWQEMMTTANEWIEGSLPLRSLAGRRKLK